MKLKRIIKNLAIGTILTTYLFGVNSAIYGEEDKEYTVVNEQYEDGVVYSEEVESYIVEGDSEDIVEEHKQRIGDSYLGWSVDYDENLLLSYNDFGGTYTYFYDLLGNYYLTVYIEDQYYEMTTDDLLETAVSNAYYYKLIWLTTEQTETGEYVRVVYRDGDWVYEDRLFLKDDKVYTLSFEATSVEDYKANNEYSELLDSFAISFSDATITEDLSNVTEDGYRLYEDSTLNYSLKIPGYWQSGNYYYYYNEMTFEEVAYGYNYEGDTLEVGMYSKNGEMTLDTWAESKMSELEDSFNPEYVTIISATDRVIDGKNAKEVLYSMNYGDYKLYISETIMIDEYYTYNLTYTMTESHYLDPAFIEQKNVIIDSFSTGEVDVYEVGYLWGNEESNTEVVTSEVSSEVYGWSIVAPDSWIDDYYGYSDDYVYASNEDGTTYFELSILDDYYNDYESVEDVVASFDEYYVDAVESGEYSFYEKTLINEKGLEIYKYDVEYSDYYSDYDTYYETYYIFEHEGSIYLVIESIMEMYASETNLEILDSIWESLELNAVQETSSNGTKYQ